MVRERLLEHEVAPFAGAWIEIDGAGLYSSYDTSLPSRERGLKLFFILLVVLAVSRSLRGSVD